MYEMSKENTRKFMGKDMKDIGDRQSFMMLKGIWREQRINCQERGERKGGICIGKNNDGKIKRKKTKGK